MAGWSPSSLGGWRAPAGFFLAAALLGIGFGLVVPAGQAMVINQVPPHRRGAANATLMTAFDLGIGLRAVLLGACGWRPIRCPDRSEPLHRPFETVPVARSRVGMARSSGTTIERRVSECHITLPQGEGHTPVILGEPGDEALLGVVTLEILGLVLNPFSRQLQPMRMLLV